MAKTSMLLNIVLNSHPVFNLEINTLILQTVSIHLV